MRGRLLAAGAMIVVATAAGGQAPTPPVATYWMDVATQSGLGMGMMGGGGRRPSMGDMMRMMSGGGADAVNKSLELKLISRERASGAPAAAHLPPAGLAMGERLPLLSPAAPPPPERPVEGLPQGMERPRGRMLIYWGCGDRAGPGQPTVIDFSRIAAGQVPPGLAAMSAMARAAVRPSGAGAAGYGEWPNRQDSRAVPARGSLAGAHRIEGNYSPPIGFSLSAAQDFMPALGLAEAGVSPGGGARLTWRAAPQATGYALAMFGGSPGGDVVMWSSARTAVMPHFDYLSPAEVRRQIGLGAVLAPTVSECVVPQEVVAASPGGMTMMIGYGPEVDFAEAPRNPKWVAKLRYKSVASLIRGMGAAMRGAEGAQAEEPKPAEPRRRRRGLGDILKGTIPIP